MVNKRLDGVNARRSFNWWSKSRSQQGADIISYNDTNNDIYWGAPAGQILTQITQLTHNSHALDNNKTGHVTLGLSYQF